MQNKKTTFRKIVTYLNNKEEEGGFWLPNIQRPFIWSEDQICRLFDSIMREYPIGTLLIWKTKSDMRHRKFIDNWKDTLRMSDFYVPGNGNKKCLVLDGQQRLQSLYIGLCGSYEGKELCFDILSGEISAPEDTRYKFQFLEPSNIRFPNIKFKDLVNTQQKRHDMADEIVKNAGRILSKDDERKIDDHLEIIDTTFKIDEAITYQELDSIDCPELYTEDDVVEIFIRANSGGTKLGKSDLLFSLLSASWEIADSKLEELLEKLNRTGFAFDRDFVLKTCLVLLKQGAKYEVAKFRKVGIRERIENEWDLIAMAIQDVLDYVRGKTYIQCDKAMPTYLVLIPLIYLNYMNSRSWKQAKNVDSYLLRCSLTGAFGGVPDNLIDALVRKIDEVGLFSLDEMFGVIRTQRRTLEISEERFWEMGYGSKTIHLLFNWWYRDFNHTPAYENNMPQIDHIFPQSALRKVTVLNPDTGKRIMKYPDAVRNQLANCMLLSREENGAGGKGDTLPEVWFEGKDRDYLDKHMIPQYPELWRLDKYEDFIQERKKIMLEKYKDILV